MKPTMTTTASIGFLPDEVYTDKILNGQISTGGSKEDVKLLYVFCPKNFRRNKLGRLKGDVLVLPQRAQNHIKFCLYWQCLLSIDNFLSVYIQNESIIQFELWALNTLHFGIGVCVYACVFNFKQIIEWHKFQMKNKIQMWDTLLLTKSFVNQ